MTNILIAHPDHFTQRAIEVTLRDLHYNTTQARDGLDAIDQALDAPPDAIVLGTGLTGLNGIDAARALRALSTTNHIPILFITNDAFDSANVQQAGLANFDWVELPLDLPRMRGQLNQLLDNASAAQSTRAESDYQLSAISDTRTGLYGRTYMLHRLAYEAARAARYQHPISAVLIGVRNIEDFKQAGQSGTDRVHITIANFLRRSLRVVDLVGRTDTSEFLIIAPHTDASGAEALAKRIQKGIESAGVDLNGAKMPIQVCVGIGVSSTTSLADNLALFARAESALDTARNSAEQSIIIG